jgi:hypothetical protein
VARVNLKLFIKFQGLSTKSRPWLNIEQVQGPFCKVVRIIRFLNYFLMGKRRGPGPQLVDHGGAGPQWTLDRGSAMTSPELSLAAAPGHGGSSSMAQRRGRSTGSPSRASPGRERRW